MTEFDLDEKSWIYAKYGKKEWELHLWNVWWPIPVDTTIIKDGKEYKVHLSRVRYWEDRDFHEIHYKVDRVIDKEKVC